MDAKQAFIIIPFQPVPHRAAAVALLTALLAAIARLPDHGTTPLFKITMVAVSTFLVIQNRRAVIITAARAAVVKTLPIWQCYG